MTRPAIKTPLVLAALIPLAGCISFGAKPPPSLLTLTSAASVPPGQPQTSASEATILITVPTVSQSLATARVPVQASDTSVAYVVGALWVEPPNRLFARLLSDTVTARTGRVVVSAGQSFADPGARLSGELRSFGMDAASSAAVVTYDAALIRKDGGVIEKERFEVRVPVATIDATASGVAINQAANQVATQVADWVGR